MTAAREGRLAHNRKGACACLRQLAPAGRGASRPLSNLPGLSIVLSRSIKIAGGRSNA